MDEDTMRDFERDEDGGEAVQDGDIERQWGDAPVGSNAGGEWDESDTPDGAASQEPERFKLKHLGREIEVSRDEMITLAQKGQDYDRIRERADALARERDGGNPEFEALRQSERKRDAEVEAFLSEYGVGVDPASIPAQVWEEVSSGKPLLAAYQSYENKRLRDELSSARLTRENSSRSSGSRSGDRARSPRGELESDWYSD
jgi:hypothetical protein